MTFDGLGFTRTRKSAGQRIQDYGCVRVNTDVQLYTGLDRWNPSADLDGLGFSRVHPRILMGRLGGLTWLGFTHTHQ